MLVDHRHPLGCGSMDQADAAGAGPYALRRATGRVGSALCGHAGAGLAHPILDPAAGHRAWLLRGMVHAVGELQRHALAGIPRWLDAVDGRDATLPRPSPAILVNFACRLRLVSRFARRERPGNAGVVFMATDSGSIS